MKKTESAKTIRSRGTPKYRNSFSREGFYPSARDGVRRKPAHKRSNRETMRLFIVSTAVVCVLLVVLLVVGIFRLFEIINQTNVAVDTQGYAVSEKSEALSEMRELVPSSAESEAPSLPAAVSGTEYSSAPAAEPTPGLMPTPPAGSPEYMFKYPEMYVEKIEFQEIDPEKKLVYLTFDDGPSANTDGILNQLDLLGVKATFFVTGMHDSREAIVSKLSDIDSRGHKLGVHTYSHDYEKIYASVDAYLDDFKQMDDMILEATGKRSGIYRYPGGSNTGYNEGIRVDMLTEMMRRGYVFHDWNASNGDSDGLSPWEETEKAIYECESQNRSILLMHDASGKAQVVDSLAPIVTRLLADGYQFELLDETVKPIQFSTLEPVG